MPWYVGDWLKDPLVRSLPPDARALWFDMLCYMWESPERGVMVDEAGTPYTDSEIIRMVGLDNQNSGNWLNLLERKKVFSRREENNAIYSRRMVRDVCLSKIRSEAGKKGGNPDLLNQSAKQSSSNLDKQNASRQVKQIPEYEYEYENDIDSEDEKEEKEEAAIDSEVYMDIIGHMNTVFGTSYRATTESTRRLIRGRFRDGFTKKDFYAVHLKKWADWKDDPKMAKYLRPATLYAQSKFEGYLNQISTAERSRMQSLVAQAMAKYGATND